MALHRKLVQGKVLLYCRNNNLVPRSLVDEAVGEIWSGLVWRSGGM